VSFISHFAIKTVGNAAHYHLIFRKDTRKNTQYAFLSKMKLKNLVLGPEEVPLF
jgi:hypothetical protein